MENVAVDWVGAAIGGAVGAAAWAGSQLWNVGSSVVDTVVDAVQSLQPSPYEEWLNAPTVQSTATTLDFRDPRNETNNVPTMEEIITNAAYQETQTGIQSPLGPEGPNETQVIPPLNQYQDPQSPMTPDYLEIPEKYPVKPLGSNVILSYYTTGTYNPDSDPGIKVIPIFRGMRLRGSVKRGNQMVYTAVPKQKNDGSVSWTLKIQSMLGTTVVDNWSIDAGSTPPSDGEIGQLIRIDEISQEFDMFDSSNFFPGTRVRRYSLSTPDIPPQIESFPELIFKPQAPQLQTNDSWIQTDWNTPVVGQPPGLNGFFPQANIPTLPPTVIPLPTNNPSKAPVIGTNGLPVLTIVNQPVTPIDVHVVNGVPVNSGAIRNDISSVAKEIGRIESKAASIMGNLPSSNSGFDWTALWLALNALAELFEQPLPAADYALTGVCEDVDENGNQPRTEVNLPEQKWADRVIALGDMMPTLLQAQKNYKQPICEPQSSIPEGDWRTISFRSAETSPYGKSRLRKRFRYLSVSGNDVGTVVDHWKDFTWESGPYRVRWIGKSWRTPEVWAATEAEGQRVIQHAAREAGFSPLEDGRWSTRVSSSARLGVSGQMSVDVTGGYYWITARDGSSNRPIVAMT